MKYKISRKETIEKIKSFFGKCELNYKEIKKIKRFAMSKNIQLKDYKKRFCKKCLSDLKNGKVRVSKFYKSVECSKCKFKNRWKIKPS